MLDTTKRTLATLTAATFLGAGGWAIAQNGATTAPQTQAAGTAPAAGYGGPMGRMGQTVSADVLAKITAAVTAKLSGATVLGAHAEPDGTYDAMARRADGTMAHVRLDASFTVTAVEDGHGRRGMHGRGMGGTPVTGTALTKVTSAVTAKFAGATVEHAMKASDGTYHAHVVKKDGTHVHVTLSTAFAITAVDAPPKGGPGMRGPGGRHGAEAALTGDVAAKVKAAALAKVPGATVDRLERDADGGVYEAHLTKADGTRVTVMVGADFTVTAVQNG